MSSQAQSHEALEWTPARVFMAVSAVFHLPLAVAAFVYDRTFPIGPDAAASAEAAHVFGVFETNGWHSLGALIVGGVSLYYALRPRHARDGALVLGVSHVVLFASLILWDPSTFWIASNAADQVVHASTAIGGTVSALATRPRRSSTEPRRQPTGPGPASA
jgi:hypothetical protein